MTEEQQIPVKKPLYRRIPGFRSGKPWKMVLAGLFYLFVFLMIITPSSKDDAKPSDTPAIAQPQETPEEKQARLLQESAENYQKGIGYFEQKDYPMAERHLMKVYSDDPNYQDAQAKLQEIKKLLAASYLASAKDKIKQGQYDEASLDLTRALANNAGLKEAADLLAKIPDMEKEAYKKSCKAIEFKVLNKNPDFLKGERITMKGEVLQIQESGNFTTMLVEVTHLGYGVYTDTVMVVYDGTIDIFEDDVITFWGEVLGSQTYKSVAGWNITVPKIDGMYFVKHK
jgi:tetratricopeptide (TPR) repeat protein